MATAMLGPTGAQLGNYDVSLRIRVGTPGWEQEAHWVGDIDNGYKHEPLAAHEVASPDIESHRPLLVGGPHRG
jgi:hypothetical protein